MSALTDYIDAWVAHDVDRIAAAVTSDCVIIECYGPVYRGRNWVRRWASEWFAAGGAVHRWEVTDHFTTGDREAAQWTFECTWDGRRSAFEGASIARSVNGQIVELREYQTTSPLYDWRGAWR
ncbi:MAG: nuclear transport factor 2 family protein [Actinomyces ruminicola]|uniref:SnoaL-like domain-containing protein n=1 Tax=Actinomyces ruminicola TaxID=332524 RepID=A0A1H0D067_9ACTO|nr:nuclear transport factor 2 family protein [Actinomyces ruminicola]MBE6483041.1 nuclear transport factor 2 family protein [Actinomyces ruminicola]SDM62292.1 SnoaL-like domain-containing protein [Actinomyces ruminicola]SDN63544.1 SnoaL-like domain-containing protein [Actinomyces ruminicola]